MLSELPLRSQTMWPTLQSGDYLLVEYFVTPKPISDFMIGEIVVHREMGDWTVDRVIEHKEFKVLKGDASNSYVFELDRFIWGRVHGYKRKGARNTWGVRGPLWSKATAKLSSLSLKLNHRPKKIDKILIYVLSRLQFL